MPGASRRVRRADGTLELADSVGNVDFHILPHPVENFVDSFILCFSIPDFERFIQAEKSAVDFPLEKLVFRSPCLRNSDMGIALVGGWTVEVSVNKITSFKYNYDVWAELRCDTVTEDDVGETVDYTSLVRVAGTTLDKLHVGQSLRGLNRDGWIFFAPSIELLVGSYEELRVEWHIKFPEGVLKRSDQSAKTIRDNMVRNVQKCFADGLYTDFKIICQSDEGEDRTEFAVHRSVLSASSVFRTMLDAPMTENKTGECIITDVSCDALKNLLGFLYGQLKEDEIRHPVDLYYAADKYDLPDLRAICCRLMGERMKLANTLQVYKIALDNKRDDLKWKVIRHISRFYDEFLEMDGKKSALDVLGCDKGVELFVEVGKELIRREYEEEGDQARGRRGSKRRLDE